MTDKPQTKSIPSNEDLARSALDEASEKLGSDIVLLDTRGISSFADFFVIISGETDRHIESMAEDIGRRSRDMGVPTVTYSGLYPFWNTISESVGLVLETTYLLSGFPGGPADPGLRMRNDNG